MIKSGGLGEIAVCKFFLKEGYEVYSSVSDNSTYDFIVIKGNITSRVEVKSTSTLARGSNKWCVQLKKVRSNRTENKITNFDSSELDLLAIYVEPEDRVIIYKAKDIKQKSTMVV